MRYCGGKSWVIFRNVVGAGAGGTKAATKHSILAVNRQDLPYAAVGMRLPPRSNHLNDFDGDGCVDGVEDPDDDGDHIPNGLDRCPRTERRVREDRVGRVAEGSRPAKRSVLGHPVSWLEIRLEACWVPGAVHMSG